MANATPIAPNLGGTSALLPVDADACPLPPPFLPDPPTPTMDERQDLDAIDSLVYEELRRLARAVLRREVHATLSPTTLVHEA